MVTVTDKAIDFLMNLFLKMDKDKKVRIAIDDSCQALELVLDDAQSPEDTVIMIHGITFLIEKDLYEKAKPVEIDFIEYTPGAGFKITSSLASGGA